MPLGGRVSIARPTLALRRTERAPLSHWRVARVPVLGARKITSGVPLYDRHCFHTTSIALSSPPYLSHTFLPGPHHTRLRRVHRPRAVLSALSSVC